MSEEVQDATENLEGGDGFQVAEEDLKLRGPGDVLGTRQSGLPEFQMAELPRDLDWLETAKRCAHEEGEISIGRGDKNVNSAEVFL